MTEGPPATLSFFSFFASFGYASVACHYLLSRPHGASRRLITLLIAVLIVVSAIALVRRVDVLVITKAALAAAGILGVMGYLRDAIAAGTPAVRRERLASLRNALIVPLAAVQASFFLWSNARINPVYDARVLGFEQKLGLPFSAVAMQVYELAGPVNVIATACYLAMPVGLSVIAVLQPSSRAMTRVLLALVLAGLSGFCLYGICPVVGPVQSFGIGFLPRLPHLVSTEMVPLTIPGHVPRNGMPSLHTVWALLIMFNAIALPARWRTALVVFALLNVCAAMGRYQHWFMDLVVAVPLAVLVQVTLVSTGATAKRWRWMASGVCAALVFTWLIGLRAGLFLGSPGWLAWLAVGLTVLCPLWWVSLTTSRRRAAGATPCPCCRR